MKGNQRSTLASRNIVIMFFAKGTTVLISLMYVPLLINVLDASNYGIWLTISSVIAWLNLLDIGLGNGLRNLLSESLAYNDTEKARTYISTAYFGILLLCVFLALIFFLFSHYINWSVILNAPQTLSFVLSKLMNIVFLMFCLQFFFSLINSILFAFQMPAYSSVLSMLGQLLSFISILYTVNFTSFKSLLYIGSIISAVPVVVLLFFTIYLFKVKFKNYCPGFKYIKFTYLNKILKLGLGFFVLQIITIVLYQFSNIIIAHTVGQTAVTEYNISFKYIGVISMIFSIVVIPFWSATTDAFVRGELGWIKNSLRKLNYIWIALSAVGLLLVFISRFVYDLWLGGAINVNYNLLLLIWFYFTFNMAYASHSYILNGIGKIKLQLILTSIVALFYVPLAVLLGSKYGVEGVVISNVIVFAFNFLWARYQLKMIVSGKAKGVLFM